MKKTKEIFEWSGTNDMKGKVSIKSPEHKIRQSINQKTERSEQDVKDHFREVLLPLTVLVVINLLFTFAILVR